MRFFICLLFALCLARPGHSQYYDASTSLVVGAEVAVPMSPISNTHSVGGGVSMKIRIPAGYNSDVFFTGNISGLTGKTVAKRKYPLQKIYSAFVGYRVYLNPLSDYSSFYIQGDVGAAAVTSKIINPVIAPSFGYLINDRLDLSLRYQTILSSNAYAKVSFIGLGIGYGINVK